MADLPALLLGVDIGGTRCSVSLGSRLKLDDAISVLATRMFPTPPTPASALRHIIHTGQALLTEHSAETGQPTLAAVGVSCGGPLDSRRGLVLGPPNLPAWKQVDVVKPLCEAFGVPAALENDANAGALAEWRWGAGKGCQHLIFLTFGTGFGAGLILNGSLYRGASDLAGEIGHVRLPSSLDASGIENSSHTVDEPVGYGKTGSVEGWLAGAGIARQARQLAEQHLLRGEHVGYASPLADLEQVTAQQVALAAAEGDTIALGIFNRVSQRLGLTLALLVDLLNPERIILGSIYTRQQHLLEAGALEMLRREALPASLAACQIVPAALGEHIGTYASLAVADALLSARNQE